MKQYPSIPKKWKNDLIYKWFPKYDGSNIRIEINKHGIPYKWGSRKSLIDENSVFSEIIDIYQNKYQNIIEEITKKEKWLSIILFFEYWGENSFAGEHTIEDNKNLTLLDINVYKKGFLPYDKINDIFNNYDIIDDYLMIPKPILISEVNENLINMVKNLTLEGQTFEGIVGKCFHKNQLEMVKLKSDAWLEKIREKCKGNQKLFDEIS